MQAPLCSVAGVKALLARFHITPNKALGQNFLVDAAARARMLEGIPLLGAALLEIGPGLGALTEGLLNAGAARVLAVEKDGRMAEILREVCPDTRLHILHEDILRVAESAILQCLGTPFLIAGNLPYYITTPIVLRCFSWRHFVQGMLFMVQKEAAARFFARPGTDVYGPLAAFAQCMFTLHEGPALSPGAYFPQPDVHSAVVYLSKNEEADAAGFLPFLQSAFAMRRKTLYNNLCVHLEKQAAQTALSHAQIEASARAEALSPQALLALYRAVERLSNR